MTNPALTSDSYTCATCGLALASPNAPCPNCLRDTGNPWPHLKNPLVDLVDKPGLGAAMRHAIEQATVARISKERLGVIKQTPRQASIDDIEWLCEEVERLRNRLDKFRGLPEHWIALDGDDGEPLDPNYMRRSAPETLQPEQKDFLRNWSTKWAWKIPPAAQDELDALLKLGNREAPQTPQPASKECLHADELRKLAAMDHFSLDYAKAAMRSAAYKIESLQRERDEVCNKLSALHEGAGATPETGVSQPLEFWKSEAIGANTIIRELRAIVSEQQRNCSCPYGDCSTCERAKAAVARSPEETPERRSCHCPAPPGEACQLTNEQCLQRASLKAEAERTNQGDSGCIMTGDTMNGE